MGACSSRPYTSGGWFLFPCFEQATYPSTKTMPKQPGHRITPPRLEMKQPRSITVMDSRTAEIQKVACMSCIRGHRTAFCGRSVCHPKIFWTVSKPGRPATACTCSLRETDRCKCTRVQSKKQSREVLDPVPSAVTNERRCCLLNPSDWEAISLQQRPEVVFYPSAEALRCAPDDGPDFGPSPLACLRDLPQRQPEYQGTVGLALPSVPVLRSQLPLSAILNPSEADLPSLEDLQACASR